MAGKRKGKEDERHLWPEMLRAIKEIQPRWVVGENVYGLVNWSNGVVFHEVQADLEAAGYEVFPYVLPAASVGAPHRRDRIWFVAYSTNYGYDAESETGDNAIRQNNKQSRTQRKRTAQGLGNERTAPNPNRNGLNGSDRQHEINASKGGEYAQCDFEQMGGDVADTAHTGLERSKVGGSIGGSRSQSHQLTSRFICSTWQNFPTQRAVRRRDDWLSRKMAIFLVNEVKNEISKTSKENRIENLQEVWERVQQEEVWEKIRRFYSLECKELLFQTMQLYSSNTNEQVVLSPFSKKVSEVPLRTLQKYGEFRSSPQGQELEKQRIEQFGNTLSFLPHEVALAARAYTNSIRKFESWHRNEAIKAYGNAIVPQVALQIFKTIQQYEKIL